jgi:hypothetical protein
MLHSRSRDRTKCTFGVAFVQRTLFLRFGLFRRNECYTNTYPISQLHQDIKFQHTKITRDQTEEHARQESIVQSIAGFGKNSCYNCLRCIEALIDSGIDAWPCSTAEKLSRLLVYMIALRTRIISLVESWERPIDERKPPDWESAVVDPMERLWFWVTRDIDDLFESVEGRCSCHRLAHRKKEFALDAFAPSLKKMLSDSIQPLDDSIDDLSSKDIIELIRKYKSTNLQRYAAGYCEP